MTPLPAPHALIAEDEPLLAQALATELQTLWPSLRVVTQARNGREAVTLALRHLPDILWLDIRMPELSGLDVAESVLSDWPAERPWPLIVFVTAYDEHAMAAFERSAVDYVLKPWQSERLRRTCDRLQTLLKGQQHGVLDTTAPAHWPERWQSLMRHWPAAPASESLTTISASQGSTLHFIPVDQVLYFEASDKYVQVVSTLGQHWIRTPLKELLARLPPGRFQQIHRSTVIRLDALTRLHRDDAGRCWAHLAGIDQPLSVSRLHAQQFKPM